MREYKKLNTKWAFSKEADRVPEVMPENWYWVNLPHCWNAIDGQDGGADYYRGTCYYAKEILKSELPKNQQYYLELLGANSSADVYVNEKKLAHHDGGYSTWRVNLTESLTEERNLLVIAVDNSENQTVYPQMADFTFYGGIYRDVNLIAVNESHFDLDYYGGPGIKVTPELNGEDAKVAVEVFLTDAKPGQSLVYTIKDQEGTVVAQECRPIGDNAVELPISGVHRWNGKKDPYLYTAQVVLKDKEEELDAVSVRFGCRTYEIDPEKGFLLNGESYPLRGVSRHQDRWGLGNALLPEHHREDMDLICELGATTIRLAHYQHDQYFYDLCDERGMVIWAESWYGGSIEMNGPWFDHFHEEFPDIPIGVSEYGCEALNWHNSNPKAGDYTEEYQAHYHEELIKQLYTRPYLWATHVWNMFDFGADARNEGGENGQNHKGLVTFDRKYKKDAFYAYKAWLSDEPFVHICGKRYVDRVEDTTKVTVYSNLPEVELFVNGRSLGKQESAEHFFYFEVPNEGESTLTAVAGDCRDESRIRKVETFNESYRLKEEGAVLNWFDITEPEGYFSLNDTVEDIIRTEDGKTKFLQAIGAILARRPREEDGEAEGEKKPMFNDSMLKMLGSFTVLRMIGMMGTAGLEPMTKEEMLELNAVLNTMKK